MGKKLLAIQDRIWLIIVLALFGMALLSSANQLYNMPMYSNMSDQQAFAQTENWFELEANACRAAGQSWIAGFADAGCTGPYERPTHPDVIKPVLNPIYYRNTGFATLFGIVAMCSWVLGFALIVEAFAIHSIYGEWTAP